MPRKPNHVNGAATEGKKNRRGLWSPEEDERLYTQITCHGVSTWSSVSQLAGLNRSGKSCRLRWMNYLRPDLCKEPISKQEEDTIISLQQSLGNRWSAIAAKLPGRTNNEIKNYWNSCIRKRLNATAMTNAIGKEDCTQNVATAAAAPSLLQSSRFPVFECQLLHGSSALPSSTTTLCGQKQNGYGGSSEAESEAIAGSSGGGKDDAHHTACGGDVAHDGDYADLLTDNLPVLMDEDSGWESELFSPVDSLSWGFIDSFLGC